MTVTNPPTSVTIVGAGLAGSLMAIFLARRGFNVEVYERRGDVRSASEVQSNRSINLGMSRRGVEALTRAGLIDMVMPHTICMKGRVIHSISNTCTFQSYGKNAHEVLYSILRQTLNSLLITSAETFPNVRFYFQKQCIHLDKTCGAATFQDKQSGEHSTVIADFIIGADGSFSTVRQQMQQGAGMRANYAQEFLEWGYKELVIPPGPQGTSLITINALHVWPRNFCTIVSHPNVDGSHTCTLFLPFEGQHSFEALRTESDVLAFFQSFFGDLVALIPTLVEQFMRNPVASLVTIQTDPWYYQDRIILLGDACHAVFPFYGQGMNAAFEDCVVLDECIGRNPTDRAAAFLEYQTLRKCNTDTLAELSKQNFVELRDKLTSPLFIVRKKADIILNRLFPRSWLPLYTMVAHTTVPYSEALARAQQQERILKYIGLSTLLLSAIGIMKRAGRQLSSQ